MRERYGRRKYLGDVGESGKYNGVSRRIQERN